VLITVKGGTGKSTTALTSLQAGLRYVGDDYVIVRNGDPPVVWSLYRTAKIDEASMPQFSVLNPQLGRSGTEEKAVITLDTANGASLARSLRLRAVLTPEFGTGAGTEIEPASRQKVRDAALFTTLLQLPHVGQRTLEFIDDLLDRLPTFVVRLGREREAVPVALGNLLRREVHKVAMPSIRGRARLPLVSVVIPVHNGARFLGEAIESVLAQDYPALDIIIVDDGSLDDIGAAVAALPVDVRFLKQLNAGPAAARNRGVINAAADFVAFLDVDDLWTEGALRSGIETLLADRSLDVVKGRGQLLIQQADTGAWHEDEDPTESFPYWIGSAVYRREAFRTIGLFDEKLRFGEDSDWFLRAKDRGARVEHVERTTLLVRRHDANMTHGKSGTELVPLRLFKNVLDRRRGN
jgi:GT2 family glycosyltransferase